MVINTNYLFILINIKMIVIMKKNKNDKEYIITVA